MKKYFFVFQKSYLLKRSHRIVFRLGTWISFLLRSSNFFYRCFGKWTFENWKWIPYPKARQQDRFRERAFATAAEAISACKAAWTSCFSRGRNSAAKLGRSSSSHFDARHAQTRERGWWPGPPPPAVREDKRRKICVHVPRHYTHTCNLHGKFAISRFTFEAGAAEPARLITSASPPATIDLSALIYYRLSLLPTPRAASQLNYLPPRGQDIASGGDDVVGATRRQEIRKELFARRSSSSSSSGLHGNTRISRVF